MKPTYPALEDFVYLNTPEQGLISQELSDYRRDLNQRIMNDPLIMMNQRQDFIEKVRVQVAEFLDANRATTALIPNFSFAFNALLAGMNASYKFLLVKGDYPSINWPVEAMGFECCYASLDKNLEHNILEAVKKDRPDVLCISIVQYISGIKIDLDFLKTLKQEYPDLIIIADGTQYVGTEEFRFRESGIDILAASCYKWMHAGNGNGFICFKEAILDRVKPKYINIDTTVNFSNDRGSFMGLFEPGHHDLINFGSLGRAIQIIDEIGIETISKNIERISQIARPEFIKRGLLSEDVVQRTNHSCIFNLNVSEVAFKDLIRNKVLCSQRGDGIRVGFTYFNDLSDVNSLLTIIDQHS